MDPGGTDWSEWAWDYSQNCWYRARKDAQAQTAPRGNVDDLANSLSNVNLGIHQGTHYTQDGAYTYGAPVPVEGAAAAAGMYGASSAQAAHSAFSAKGQGRSADTHSKHRSRDKPSSKKQRPRTAKTGSYEDSENPTPAHMAPFYKRTGTAPGSDYPPASDAEPCIHQEYADTYESSHESAYASGFSQASSSSQPYRQGPPAEFDAEDESSSSGTVPPTSDATEYPDAAGEDDTRRYSTGQESVASDTSGDLLHDALLQAEADPYHTGDLGSPYSGGESSSMAAAQSHHMYPPSEDNGRETPRPSFSQRPTTSMTETEDYQHQTNGTESITSGQEPGSQDGYVVERSSRFQPGEVFKINWCEPLGAGPPKSEVMTHQVRFEQNGRSFYQGLRRFIVVANDEGHCTCVPILTYEHQACRKRGVKPLKHGIIYQSGKRPKKLDGEPQLGFDPVCVNLYERTERLVKESRVNYAKLTTIEHNFPVFFIGSIDPADFHNVVRPAVDTCWEKKKRHASTY
ncbi:hypothetical protein F5144DRAFT_642630 [Chaetomium tenue]|uniref:Uncharacterized protein n=1 Tax=Chaetomium tenue TaxID=1854479 RepID=A0ACB7PIL3_9PEZI|nr:hypothetical protein F5144DRAFT_642630 [Chaetomium globosum]